MSTPLWICKARFSSEVIQNLLWSFMLHARASIYFTFNYLYRFLYLCCGFVLFQLFSVVAVLCSFIFSISVYGLSLYFIIVCIFLRIKMVIWSIGLPSGYRSAFTNNSCSKIRSVHVIYPIWSDLIWPDLNCTGQTADHPLWCNSCTARSKPRPPYYRQRSIWTDFSAKYRSRNELQRPVAASCRAAR